MKKIKPVVARDLGALARVLGLSRADAAEIELRRQLNEKIIEAVERSGHRPAVVAKAARVSPGRLSAILARDVSQASTSMMLRILTALGYRPRVTFVRTRSAA